MTLARGFLVALVLAAGCGGRQTEAGPAPSGPAPVARAQPQQQAAAPAKPAGKLAAPTRERAAAPADDAPTGGQPGVFVPTATDQVFVRRMLDVIDEVATIMEKQQDACGRMAVDLEGVMLRNQDLIFMAKQMKGNPAREKWMQDQAMERLQKAATRMMTGFQKCQNDPAVLAVIRKLGA